MLQRNNDRGPRQIIGLKAATFVAKSPWPKVRARGAKAKGLAYQRKVGRMLRTIFGSALHEGRWIFFEDSNGRGFAQPDFFVALKGRVIVFEAKLSQCESGLAQIDGLYRPLLRHLSGLPVVGVMICKNLYVSPYLEISDLSQALAFQANITLTYHWLGR